MYVRGEVVRADGVKVLAVSRGKGFAFLPYSALSFTVEPEMVRVTEELVPEAASGTGEHVYRMAGAPGKVKKLTKELDPAGKSGDTAVAAYG